MPQPTPEPAHAHGLRIQDQPESPRSPEDQIDAWLDVLVRLLDLPADEREGLRDELAAHLHERVRDLTLAGTDSTNPNTAPHTDPVTRAIAELGDQAELARALRNARHTPRRRRTLMLAGLIGTSAAALLISTAALVQSSAAPRTPNAVAAAAVAADTDEPGVLEMPITGTYEKARVSEVLRDVAAQVGRDVRFSRNLSEHLSMVLEPGGEPVHKKVTAALKSMPLEEAVNRLGIAMRYDEGLLQVRDRGDHLFFGFRPELDEMEAFLMTHDLAPLLDLGLASSEIHGVLTQFVEPDEWRYNGGTFAIEIVREKALVEAPPRMQAGVEETLAVLEASFARQPDDPRSREIDLEHVVAPARGGASPQTRETIERIFDGLAAAYPGAPTPAVAIDYDTHSYMVYGNLHQRNLAKQVIERFDAEPATIPGTP